MTPTEAARQASLTESDFGVSRWIDRETNGRVVTPLRYGGNGVWYRYEDDGIEWHCCSEDWFLWKRFTRLTPDDRAAEVRA